MLRINRLFGLLILASLLFATDATASPATTPPSPMNNCSAIITLRTYVVEAPKPEQPVANIKPIPGTDLVESDRAPVPQETAPAEATAPTAPPQIVSTFAQSGTRCEWYDSIGVLSYWSDYPDTPVTSCGSTPIQITTDVPVSKTIPDFGVRAGCENAQQAETQPSQQFCETTIYITARRDNNIKFKNATFSIARTSCYKDGKQAMATTLRTNCDASTGGQNMKVQLGTYNGQEVPVKFSCILPDKGTEIAPAEIQTPKPDTGLTKAFR